MSQSPKSQTGRFFEDFRLGETIRHAVPRTLGEGEAALYLSLYGGRFPLQSSLEAARQLDYPDRPLDDWLVFHTVFGKSVPDISLNAVANLGYGEGRFLKPVFPGDTLSARSTIIGIKETSKGESGIVYLRTEGENQRGETVLTYLRWVLVRKRDLESPPPDPVVPDVAESVAAADLAPPPGTDFTRYDTAWTDQPALFEDYAPGERIDHLDGQTVEEAEHQLATRLYQNTARVHFNQHVEGENRFGRRLIYGGHVISLARALGYNGLGNAVALAALHGGRHVAPLFGGDTLYAWSEVLAADDLPGRRDLGVLRLRTVALKNRKAAGFPYKAEDGAYESGVALDLDYSVFMPRRVP